MMVLLGGVWEPIVKWGEHICSHQARAAPLGKRLKIKIKCVPPPAVPGL